MIITILLTLCILVILMPQRRVLHLYQFALRLIYLETPFQRGEKLNYWLSQCRLDAVGFDLGRELPARDCYKFFGEELHFAWEQVRQYGGGLGPCLQGMRHMLRQDLKFEKRKRSIYRGTLLQVGIMLVTSWAYVSAYLILEIAQIPYYVLLVLGTWQVLGAFFYYYFLLKQEKRLFRAAYFFMHNLIKLSIFMRAGVNLSKLEAPIYLETLSTLESILYDKLSRTMMQWRELGVCREDDLKELEAEYWFCLEEKTNQYLSLLGKTSFLWSLLFILPVLFATTFFSMASLLSTGQ